MSNYCLKRTSTLLFKIAAQTFEKTISDVYFYYRSNPMKYYNKVFDIFLYEGVFIFLFSLLLLLLNDIYTELFFKVAISSIITAGVLWITGHSFNLFVNEDNFDES